MSRMARTRLVGRSLAGGVVLTLLTGIVPLRTLLGGTGYGFPLPWLIRQVLAPEYSPWRVNWLDLAVDLLVWTAPVFAIPVLYDRFSRRSAEGQPT